MSCAYPCPCNSTHSLALLLQPSHHTPTVNFSPPSTTPVGANPFGVAVGDFNCDGIPNLAVANVNQALTMARSAFSSATGTAPLKSQSPSAAHGPDAVAIGDFSGEGRLGLAIGNDLGGVSILLGNGDGTFQAAVNYSSGVRVPHPSRAAISTRIAIWTWSSRMRADHSAPQSTASQTLRQAAAIDQPALGNGDGTFQAPVEFGVGAGPVSVVAARPMASQIK